MSPKIDQSPDLNAAISNADADSLREFILQYANTDSRFMNELLAAFGEPHIETEFANVKEQVSDAIHRGSRRGYIDYRGCDEICVELDEILSLIPKRISQGRSVLGFLIAQHILLTCAKLAGTADSSSGSLSSTIDYSLESIDIACQAVLGNGTADDQKLVYEKCVNGARSKVFDGWGEWNYAMLRSCTRFVTHKNVKKLYDVLDYLSDSYKDWSEYHIVDDKLTRLEIIRRLDGENSAEKYIMEHLKIDNFRNMAVDKALAKSDYSTAERLCVERLEFEPNEYGVRVSESEWMNRLYEVYEKYGNADGQIRMAQKLLLHGETRYYDILKSLLTANGTWEQAYPSLLQDCAGKLPYHLYMEILRKENEFSLLLEQVKKHPGTSIFSYGKFLAQHYPTDIYAIFRAEIKKQAKSATDRKRYRNVCDGIKTLLDAGGKDEALKLIAEFRQEYNRRPAMLDELALLEQRFDKV